MNSGKGGAALTSYGNARLLLFALIIVIITFQSVCDVFFLF